MLILPRWKGRGGGACLLRYHSLASSVKTRASAAPGASKAAALEANGVLSRSHGQTMRNVKALAGVKDVDLAEESTLFGDDEERSPRSPRQMKVAEAVKRKQEEAAAAAAAKKVA
jgi:hypothetical protein